MAQAVVRKIPDLEVAQVSKQVVYACGCIATFPIIGEFARFKAWHVIPCNVHHKLVGTVECPGELELRAQRDFSAAAAKPPG